MEPCRGMAGRRPASRCSCPAFCFFATSDPKQELLGPYVFFVFCASLDCLHCQRTQRDTKFWGL